jgi:hypothetical protein
VASQRPASPSSGATGSASPAASSACVDVGDLADGADTVTIALQGLATAIQSGNAGQEQSLAKSAAAGLRSIADLVAPAQSTAAASFHGLADKLDQAAAASFAPGSPSVTQIQADFESALLTARTARCS